MRISVSTIWACGLLSLLTVLSPNSAVAQITDQIEATLKHSFVVSNKTLPPGNYTFRMEGGGESGVMVVTSADGKASDQFLVRQSQAPRTPAHTELVFRRYGDKEFLTKVYVAGNASGVAVSETSKQEKQLIAQGQQPVEHTEEAGQ